MAVVAEGAKGPVDLEEEGDDNKEEGAEAAFAVLVEWQQKQAGLPCSFT